MTTPEFKKVARLLKEVYAQLEAEALSDGVDIFGEEYLEVRDALRLEVLKRLGFTLDEYREAKELVAPAKKVDVAQQALEASKLTQETSERIDALKIPDEEELLSKAKEIAEAVVKAPVIQNNIVERTTIEKPTIVKETVLQTVNEEYDPSEIFAELGYLNDKLEKLVIPEGVDEEKLKGEMRSEFMEHLQENINMFGMPNFRKLAMGLQGQIDDIRNSTPTGGGHVIEEEGTPLTQRTKLNFVGTAVTVTDDAGDDSTVVTITSGAGATAFTNLTDVPASYVGSGSRFVKVNAGATGLEFVAGGGGGGTVDTIVAGDNIVVDATDPANPIVSAYGANVEGGSANSVYLAAQVLNGGGA